MLTIADKGGGVRKMFKKAKCWPLLTEGGGGVSQMLTIVDGGGRGGVGTPAFG